VANQVTNSWPWHNLVLLRPSFAHFLALFWQPGRIGSVALGLWRQIGLQAGFPDLPALWQFTRGEAMDHWAP